ncbi:amino acid ABC transporter substrate-binding protein [Aestuariispira insulae]|uniref:amino acid ABC transporter substrate-binding protein n=1 Tax=Aestuariispira insulae TaxID=1461337 RepID=UPI0011C05764|nr:amino acid ABC transporter substrate-binding protein [Aestuariispira insulae]
MCIFLRFAAVAMAMVLAMVLGVSGPAQSQERIVTNAVMDEDDKRENYPYILLHEAMERTVADYGAYEIVPYGLLLQRQRALIELERGTLDVFSTATQPAWEERLRTVRIPLRKGILGYRLFLIHKDRQPVFSDIREIDLLRQMRLGSGAQWSITKVFDQLGFKIVRINSYEALFRALIAGRFDYFPRGVNEIFHEYDGRTEKLPEMAIEADLALYMPLPTYFFVAPGRERLEQRLTAGLEMMVADGSFEDLFLKHHGPSLKKARLAHRRIFRLENPDLSTETPLERPELWYAPQ